MINYLHKKSNKIKKGGIYPNNLKDRDFGKEDPRE